jgi:hypothetical protein
VAGLALASAIGVESAEVRAYATTAREIFARLGARPFLERIERLLDGQVRPGERAQAATEAVSTTPATPV